MEFGFYRNCNSLFLSVLRGPTALQSATAASLECTGQGNDFELILTVKKWKLYIPAV